MDPEIKKAVLRMIPYGIYILTTASQDRSRISSAAINWVTQCSFNPPLIAVGIKNDTLSSTLLRERKRFVLHFLAKDQARFAFDFFKETKVEGEKLQGHPFVWHLDLPVLKEPIAYLIADLRGEGPAIGDHTIFVGEVIDAQCSKLPEGRHDEAVAWLKDLGEKVYYGG
jgi:flavin reductase (DIM6/NTAB) family NADH-FMN oxidoreductase RutF